MERQKHQTIGEKGRIFAVKSSKLPMRSPPSTPASVQGPTLVPPLPRPSPKNIQLKPVKATNAPKDVYIPLYGLFTGDIWHLAATEILSEYQYQAPNQNRPDPFPGVRFRTCITLAFYDRNLTKASRTAEEKDYGYEALAPQPLPKPLSKAGQAKKDKTAAKTAEKAKPATKRQKTEKNIGQGGTDKSEIESSEEHEELSDEPSMPPLSKSSKGKGKAKGKKKADLQDQGSDDERLKEEHKVISRGRGAWRFLKGIGLTGALIIVPDRKGLPNLEHVNDSLTYEECNKAYDSQFTIEEPDFDEIVWDRIKEMWRVTQKDGRSQFPPDRGTKTEDYLVHLLVSTSIVMQQMKYLGPAAAKKILGYRLSGGVPGPGGEVPVDIRQQAAGKLLKLIKKIEIARARIRLARQGAHPGIPEFKGVIIFNYRIGDVNRQHDSNLDILRQVKRLSGERGLATIIIPQCNDKDWAKVRTSLKEVPSETDPYMDDYVFNMLGVGKEGSFLDGRVKACFWHYVASYLQLDSSVEQTDERLEPNRCVHGFIGGRSGSTDLPAFVGMNTFSWEEPLFTATRGRIPTSSGLWSAKYYAGQFPQMLRLLNEYPMMKVGFLDSSTANVSGKGQNLKLLPKESKTEATANQAKKKGKRKSPEPKTPIQLPTTSFARVKPKKRVYTRIDIDDMILQDWLNGVPKGEAHILPYHLHKKFAMRYLDQYRPRIEKKTKKGSEPGLNIRAVYLDKYRNAIKALPDDACQDSGLDIRDLYLSDVSDDSEDEDEWVMDSDADSEMMAE